MHHECFHVSPDIASQPFCMLMISRFTQFFGIWKRLCGFIARTCFFLCCLKCIMFIHHLHKLIDKRWLHFLNNVSYWIMHIYQWAHSRNKDLVWSNSWHDSPCLTVRFLVFPTIYQKHDCIAYKRLVDTNCI